MSISKFNTFPFLRRHYWKGETGSQLRFTSTNSTITPALTISGGPTPLWYVTESTGQVFKYEAASFSHTKTAGTGNLTVRLINTETVKSYVTQVNFSGDGIISSFFNLQVTKFTGLTFINLGTNNIIGDLSSVIWPIGLTQIYLNNNNFTGDLSSTVWPLGVTHLHIGSNNFTGDLSSTVWPANLTYLYLGFNSFTGDLSSAVWPTGLTQVYLFSNFFTGFILPAAGISPLQTYAAQNNGAGQAAVDAVVLAFYNNRNNFTYTTPTASIGGTNATPSGTYQDATPPTTGKEYIYKLVNDPDLEGFNKWTITYTA